MVYITNGKFVSQYLAQYENIDEILWLLDWVKSLIKKYWSRVFTENVLTSMDNVDQNFSSFVKTLKSVWKLNIKDINAIVSIIKSLWKDYTPVFDLKSSNQEIYQKVNDYITSTIGKSDVEYKKADDIWIKIVWNNFYYKRDISTDLDKLVK